VTEADLLRKLAAIEALLEGATSDGEQAAARAARERLATRLGQLPAREEDFHFTIPDIWGRKLFTALAKKLGLEPFRYRGQRQTTLVLRTMQDKKELLWKQFLAAHETLSQYLDEVTERVIREALGQATDDIAVRPAQKSLPIGG
jgi:hypothetical protein